jgi:hypothetical protein
MSTVTLVAGTALHGCMQSVTMRADTCVVRCLGACMSSERHLGHRCRGTGASGPEGQWHLAHAHWLSDLPRHSKKRVEGSIVTWVPAPMPVQCKYLGT